MGCNKRTVVKAFLLHRLIRRRNKQTRNIFLNRLVSGESVLVNELRDDPLYHHKYFRMNKENFDEILDKVRDKLQGCRTTSIPISPLEKLAVALRYLATGNSQISLSMNYRISPGSMSRIMRETLTAICEALEAEFLPEPQVSTWEKAEEGFNNVWNFPNCCGAIDGKHIRIQAPSLTGSVHFNYKGFFSLVLMAIANSNYQFTAVDIGACGSLSDGGVLARSNMGKRLLNNKFSLPEAKAVGPSQLPHVIVGDDAFPLRPYLIKPFPGRNLSYDRRIFNYRLSRARMVIENAFGILAARWRILYSTIIADLAVTKLIVKTCVLLHNFLLSKKDMNTITGDRIMNGELIKGIDIPTVLLVYQLLKVIGEK